VKTKQGSILAATDSAESINSTAAKATTTVVVGGEPINTAMGRTELAKEQRISGVLEIRMNLTDLVEGTMGDGGWDDSPARPLVKVSLEQVTEDEEKDARADLPWEPLFANSSLRQDEYFTEDNQEGGSMESGVKGLEIVLKFGTRCKSARGNCLSICRRENAPMFSSIPVCVSFPLPNPSICPIRNEYTGSDKKIKSFYFILYISISKMKHTGKISTNVQGLVARHL